MTNKIIVKQRDSGFTLIEMALVMVIGGVLLSFMGSALLMYLKKSRVQKTEYRIEAIKEALSQHLSVNRRYPCPARRDIAPGDTALAGDVGFGVEVNPNCTVGGNDLGGTADSTVVVGAGVNRVRIGSIPTRTLNLPDDMATDGWGHRFTYAVTTSLATVNGTGTTYKNDGGKMSIVDSTSTEFVNDAHYVIVSHGTTGNGSIPLNANFTLPFASIGLPCPVASLDRENCDNDNRFLVTLVNSEMDSPNFYDDYMYYQGQTAPALVIPEGAVMAFNLATCPDGWTDFADAEGKVILGMNNGSAPVAPVSYPEFDVSVGSGSSSGDYPIELDAGDLVAIDLTIGHVEAQASRSGIPPYVALLYCEKLPD